MLLENLLLILRKNMKKNENLNSQSGNNILNSNNNNIDLSI